MNHSDVIDDLNILIDTCRDGEFGFLSCAANAQRMDIQWLMTQRADAWRRAAAELHALRAASRGTSNEDTRAMPAGSRRGWVAPKSTLAGYSDLALLAECERGEEIALQRYRHALEQDLPRVARAVALRHLEGIQHNRSHMRSLRASELAAHGVGRRPQSATRPGSAAHG